MSEVIDGGSLKYDPHAPLSSDEVTLIGQALVTRMSDDARQIAAMGPEIIRYCTENGRPQDIAGVLQRELDRMTVNYRLVERFVMMPLPLEMFTNKAKQGWDQ
jgi:hypothetical protein